MAAASMVTEIELPHVRELCQAALAKCGLNEQAAAAVADVVYCAERDGCASHGLFRLPGYCAALTAGKVDGSVLPVVHDVAPATVRVDAQGGFAPPAIAAGRQLLVSKAKAGGVAALAITNSVHFAALWWEVEQLAAVCQRTFRTQNFARVLSESPSTGQRSEFVFPARWFRRKGWWQWHSLIRSRS